MTRILIIDDAEDLANLIKVNLEVEGYECYIAGDGEAGLEMAVSENPDVILLDIEMPILDGYGVLEGLKNRQDTSGIPVIMCTTKKGDEDIRQAYRMGAKEYIIKPFEMYELVKKIQKLREDG